jgi:hypothetical protein
MAKEAKFMNRRLKKLPSRWQMTCQQETIDVEASGEDTDGVDEDILDQYMIDSREELECWDE